MVTEIRTGDNRTIRIDYGKDFRHDPLGRWRERKVRVEQGEGREVSGVRFAPPRRHLFSRFVDWITGRNTRVEGKIDRALDRHSGKLAEILGNLCGLAKRRGGKKGLDFQAFWRAFRGDLVQLRKRAEAVTGRGGDYGELLRERLEVHLGRLKDGELAVLAGGLDSRCMKGFRLQFFNARTPDDKAPERERSLLEDLQSIKEAVLGEIAARERRRDACREAMAAGTPDPFAGVRSLRRAVDNARERVALPAEERSGFLSSLQGKELHELEEAILFWERFDPGAVNEVRREIDRRTRDGKEALFAAVDLLQKHVDREGVNAAAADAETPGLCRQAQEALALIQGHMESCEIARFYDEEFFRGKSRLEQIQEDLENSPSAGKELREELARLRETIDQ